MITSRLAKIVQRTMIGPVWSPSLRENPGFDSHRINVPNLVAIYGNPGSGKTSLARSLSKSKGFLHLPADPIFSSHLAPCLTNWNQFLVFRDQPNEHFSVFQYVNSSSYDHNLFIACLAEELRQRLQQFPQTHTILLDGYVFKYSARIFKELNLPPERTLALHASTINGCHMVEGFDVTGHTYYEVLKHIRDSFGARCVDITVKKSRYQSFKSFGLSGPGNVKSDSDTEAKYAASHLDDVLQASNCFVDIGCNAGYFCFRAAHKTNGSISGVDMVLSWVEIGSHINNSIFLRDNIAFFNAEALEFLSKNPDSFDVIHCASTYHYFRERQITFLREAYKALTFNGRLVLEVELSNTGAEPEITKRARGVDSTPCTFPNRAMFLQQIAGLFQIEAEFESVFQKGSFYSRVYFHLRPVQQEVRFALDKTQGSRISGWAMAPKSPQRMIKLLIKINDGKEFIVSANLYRPDLLSKGMHPTGKCGFALTLAERDILCTDDIVSLLLVNDTPDKSIPIKLLTKTRVR